MIDGYRDTVVGFPSQQQTCKGMPPLLQEICRFTSEAIRTGPGSYLGLEDGHSLLPPDNPARR
ncbi:MAG: hypothetical protein V1793_06025 [Pseudomonadota bacterium]